MPFVTSHRVFFQDARRMDAVPSGSVDLVVTSPPYPMIEMWDELFCAQDPGIREALATGSGAGAFDRMHGILEPVWNELFRVLKQGGIACVNVGDATRTLGGNFSLYSNHSRILHYLLSLGFGGLPNILWRKQTNAPNKFMGSGMLPPGAYVTLEHEFILIVRKGPKKEFPEEADKENRRRSAYFWEERNVWFSDVWMDVKGTGQELHDARTRSRSGAFPFELAYRLIHMFSVRGDTVLDPFLGTGTTMAAAMGSGRNSIGYETDRRLDQAIRHTHAGILDLSNTYNLCRLEKHVDFVKAWMRRNGRLKHKNVHYGFPVMTSQEKELILLDLNGVRAFPDAAWEVSYTEEPQPRFRGHWDEELTVGG